MMDNNYTKAVQKGKEELREFYILAVDNGHTKPTFGELEEIDSLIDTFAANITKAIEEEVDLGEKIIDTNISDLNNEGQALAKVGYKREELGWNMYRAQILQRFKSLQDTE